MSSNEDNTTDTASQLNQLADQYRRETGDENPPELVDQAILNRARRAVESAAAEAPLRAIPKGLRWVPALAAASVVVVAVAVVIEQIARGPGYPGTHSPAPSRSSAPMEVEMMSEDDLDAVLSDSRGNRPVRDLPEEQTPRTAAPAHEQYLQAPQQSPDATTAVAKKRERQQPVSSPRHEDAVQMARPPADGAPSDISPSVADNAAVESDRLDQERERIEQQLEMKNAAQAELPETQPAMESFEMLPPDPEEWLRSILRWKRMHQTQRFERELERFLEVYPDYKLPDELQRRLDQS